MVSNRKARLLLKVPAVAVGDEGYYRVSNTRNLYFVGVLSATARKYRNARQQRAINRARSIGYDF
jgi:predicted RNA-binding protein with PUA-like domain